MSEQTKTNKTVWILIAVISGLITAGAVFAIIDKGTAEPEYVEQTETTANNTLEDIVKSAESWGVAFKPWFGKAVPDFTVTDTEGREHSLSSNLGKNVLVVFWATWCPACNLEIPHLINLRKEIGEDDLAIIAISNEEPKILKDFVSDKGINYTVATVGSSVLPSPFADVTGIPTTFFIDRKGQIKLVAVGLVELDDTKAILKAE